jgi:predicted transcriptional regulator
MSFVGSQSCAFSDEELAKLKAMARAGYGSREIAKRLGRTPQGVTKRAKALGIALARTPAALQVQLRRFG